MDRRDLIVEWRSTGNGMDYLLWLEYKLMNEKPRSDVKLERYKEAIKIICSHLDTLAEYKFGVSESRYQHALNVIMEVAFKALNKD